MGHHDPPSFYGFGLLAAQRRNISKGISIPDKYQRGGFTGPGGNQFTVIPSVIVYISGKSFEKKAAGLSYIFRKSGMEACPG